MNSIRNRIDKLEGSAAHSENIIIARIPVGWGEVQQTRYVQDVKSSHGLDGTIGHELIPKSECTAPELLVAGSMEQLFEYVAEHGRRLGETQHEEQSDEQH